jgi:chorismate mutase
VNTILKNYVDQINRELIDHLARRAETDEAIARARAMLHVLSLCQSAMRDISPKSSPSADREDTPKDRPSAQGTYGPSHEARRQSLESQANGREPPL